MESKTEYTTRKVSELQSKYIIEAMDDFSVKLLYETEYDLLNTPSEHVKTKSDLIKNYFYIKDRLRLEEKPVEKFEKILLCFDSQNKMDEIYSFVHTLISPILATSRNYKHDTIKTKTKEIHFVTILPTDNLDNSSFLCGQKYDRVVSIAEDLTFGSTVHKLHLFKD